MRYERTTAVQIYIIIGFFFLYTFKITIAVGVVGIIY